MPRRIWIAAFIAHVLELGIDADLDWVRDTAAELYPNAKADDPAAAADDAFKAWRPPAAVIPLTLALIPSVGH